MKVIIRERQTGRTSELIKLCAEYDYALIVTPTRNSAFSIRKQAEKMGEHIPMPITFGEFVRHQWCGKYIQAFLIDDLDSCMKMVANGIPIHAITMERRDDEGNANGRRWKMSDLIDRQSAIDSLGERPIMWTDDDQYTLGKRNQYYMDRLAIETLPSAQQWIPCDMKEPDEIGCYLLYRPHFWRGNNGQITVCHWNGHRWSDNYMDDESRALPESRGWAWMPLPIPYRGEEG